MCQQQTKHGQAHGVETDHVPLVQINFNGVALLSFRIRDIRGQVRGIDPV